MPKKTVLQMAYEKYRKQGMRAIEAGKKAKKMAKQLVGLKKEKEELALTSSEAYQLAKSRKQLKKIQKYFRKINASYRISLNEAADIFISWDNVKPLNYKFGDFLTDYAKIRFSLYQKRPTLAELHDIIIKAVRQRLGKKPQRLIRSIKTDEIYNIRKPELGLKAGSPDSLFRRFRNEGLLYKTHSQERVLELQLNVNLTVDKKLRQIVLNGVRLLKRKPSQKLINEIREKVKGFDEKPIAIQTRIVQEARANELGNKIAQSLRKNSETNIELLFLRDGIKPKPQENFDSYLVFCLARPGNRKFLAQKAIEWFGRRRS